MNGASTPRRLLRLSAVAAVAYALGSIQVSRIVQRLVSDQPVKDHFTVEWGDGHVMRFNSAGATTVEVTAGPAFGIAASLIDMSRSVVPALVLRRACPDRHVYALWAAASVIGQMLPPQYRFKGGRGDAMLVGTCFALDPLSVPVSVVVSQLIGIYVFHNPVLGAHGWTGVLIPYFALRRKPELVAYVIAANAVRWGASISEIRQIRHYRVAGEFKTREFHEAFESNHIGWIHKWLREHRLIHYDYMDEEPQTTVAADEAAEGGASGT
ncbi:MAG: glycerol-3-phosphate acyltransferase [Chloroflexota bacterium]